MILTMEGFFMKIMHLSDLHLGKRVNEFSMLEDQIYILNEIINIIDEQKPKVIILAGDIYDKPIPPAEAVEIFDDFLYKLSKREPIPKSSTPKSRTIGSTKEICIFLFIGRALNLFFNLTKSFMAYYPYILMV